MNNVLRLLAAFAGTTARWSAAHWRLIVTALTLGVLVMALARLLLPVWAFGVMRRQLESSLLPPAASMLLAAVAAAALVVLNPPVLRWLVGGGHRREVATAVVALAIVAAIPALVQGNFRPDGTSNKWVKRNEDGTLEASSRDFDPVTGEKLAPMSKEIALQIERQSRRQPRAIHRGVCQIEFFNGASGMPQVWWGQRANDMAQLFDGPGYDPQTGKELMPVRVDQVERWTAGCHRRE